MTRAERHAQIKALRAEGLLLREIAERVGVSTSTVHDVLADPTGEKARARKARYERPCVGCGRTVNINGLRPTDGRCFPCHNEHLRKQGRLYVIESMREWAERYGAPPSAPDWNRAMLRAKACAGSGWRIKRYEDSGRPWPSVPSVQRLFGSWNEGIRAAGFTPMDPRDYPIGRAGEALRDSEKAA